MKTVLHFILILLCLSCAKERETGIIEIDGRIDYPVLDLKLNELAQVTAIPLQLGKDSVLLGSPASNRGNLFVTKDKIFIGDKVAGDHRIVVYNHQGEPLYTIGKIGRGPGEIMGSILFTIDTLSNEIFIWGSMINRLWVFDLEGNFKRENSYDQTYNFSSFVVLDSTYLMGFSENAQTYTPDFITQENPNANPVMDFGRSLHFFNRNDLSYHQDIPDIHFERIHSKNVFTGSNSLTSTREGVYFFTGRSDTIYFMDNTLKTTPKFVDVTDYGTKKGEIGIFPVLETEQYVFLSTYLSIRKDAGKERIKYLAYDKIKSKIFTLGETNRSGGNFPFNNQVTIIHNNKSQNHNYVKVRLRYDFLKENYAKLPKRLQQITDQMTENDNPVLVLIKFR